MKFSKEEESVCWHCAKLLDLFLLRRKVITFQSGANLGNLRDLRKLQNNLWSQKDFNFLVELYKNSPARKKKIGEAVDILKDQNNERGKVYSVCNFRSQKKYKLMKQTKASKARR